MEVHIELATGFFHDDYRRQRAIQADGRIHVLLLAASILIRVWPAWPTETYHFPQGILHQRYLPSTPRFRLISISDISATQQLGWIRGHCMHRNLPLGLNFIGHLAVRVGVTTTLGCASRLVGPGLPLSGAHSPILPPLDSTVLCTLMTSCLGMLTCRTTPGVVKLWYCSLSASHESCEKSSGYSLVVMLLSSPPGSLTY